MMKYIIVLIMAINLSGCNLYESFEDFMDERHFQKQLKLAESGDVEAQRIVASLYIGDWYNSENDISIDDVKNSFEWYKKAAMQGDIEAQKELGGFYGYDISKSTIFAQIEELGISDRKKSFYWYEKAALQGDMEAQIEVARKYESGSGVEKDMSKALKWYKKAAKQGDSHSALMVGYAYYGDDGIERDVHEILHWMETAARLGEGSATSTVVEILYNGYAGEVDYPEAFSKATYYLDNVFKEDNENYFYLLDDDEAYLNYMMGLMYEKGHGVRQSYDQAKEYFGKACDLGEQRACDRYSSLNTRS